VRSDGSRTTADGVLARYARALRTLAPLLAWGVAPLAVTLFGLAVSLQNHPHFGGDFHAAFWPAGQDVLHGRSPYVGASDPSIAKAIAFVYPAPAAMAFAPLAAMPRAVADAFFVILQFASVAAALQLLGVRDWRVYGVAYLWAAVVSGWLTGNVTLSLVLGLAAAWRWRDRPGVSGALVGLIVAFKLFLWPLGIWLLATRRYGSLAWAAGTGAAVTVIAWAILGFDEIRRYDRLVWALVDELRNRGFTLMSLSQDLLGSRTPGYALAIALAFAAATACMTFGRRGDDRRSLTAAVAIALLVTPLVWLHYFALFLVPVALAAPAFGSIWKLPLAFWLCVAGARRPETWQVVAALLTMALLVRALLCSTARNGLLPGTPPTAGRN
jgi:alpha-1,2-mannosyltransferase